MALSIRDEKTDALAREIAGMTGETITDAIGKALQERLLRLRTETEFKQRKAKVQDLTRRMTENMVGPVLSDDDIYDVHGMPRAD